MGWGMSEGIPFPEPSQQGMQAKEPLRCLPTTTFSIRPQSPILPDHDPAHLLPFSVCPAPATLLPSTPGRPQSIQGAPWGLR